jgi:hypothetical protein
MNLLHEKRSRKRKPLEKNNKESREEKRLRQIKKKPYTIST